MRKGPLAAAAFCSHSPMAAGGSNTRIDVSVSFGLAYHIP